MAHVNERRILAIKKLKQDHAEKDVHKLIGAIVYPIVEEIDADASGQNYIRFMAQAMGHPQLDLTKLWQQEHSDGMTRILELLRASLPNIPEPLFGQRFGLIFEQIVHSLADREKLRLSTPNTFAVDSTLFVSNLVDCITGAMAATISTNTRGELQRLAQGK